MLFPEKLLSRRRLLAMAGGMAMLMTSVAAAQSTGGEAQAFIRTLVGKAIHELTPSDISREERVSRARTLLNDNFALPTIAQFVLGRYWRTASEQQRKTFVDVFSEFIVYSYVDRFSRYAGEQLTITRSVDDTDSGDSIVFSQIDRPGGAPVEVGWRIRKIGNQFKIVDVIVENVSMGQTQRSEFASVIRNNDGSIDALLAEMRRRIEQAT